MPITSTLQWIESTDLSTAIREGALPYPIIGGFHLLAIALFGGMLVATDFRLLGWAMRGCSIAELMEQLRWWKRGGFVVVVVSGFLLAWCEPLKLYRSPSFWIKMVLFGLVGVHAVVFRDVYRKPQELGAEVPVRAKLAGAISLFLWAGLIVAGRLIAFDE